MKAFLSHLRRPAASSSATSSQSLPEYPSLVNSLPVELHLQIVSYLDQDDLIACLHTSHSLRHIWESPSIWPALADRWYPGLSTQLRLTVPVSHCGAAFRRFLTRNRRRSQGRFLSSLHHGMRLEDDEYFNALLSRALPVAQGGVHEYAAATGEGDDSGHQYTRLAHFVAYANGRIAWWPEAYSLPYFAIVDDLRTRQRRGYLFPGHGKDRTGYMTSLGDTMLLMARGKTLHAWNFAGEVGGAESLRSVMMPQRIARTLSENDTVLIVSQDGEVWLWRPRFHNEANHQQQKEEPPRKIDIASTRCYVPGHVLSDRYDIRDIAYRACRVGLRIQQPPSPPPTVVPPSSSSFMSGGGDNDDDFEQQALVTTTNNNNNNNVITLDFVLHPARRDIFFLATLRDRILTVYEFSTDGALLGTFLPDFPFPSLDNTNSTAELSTAATAAEQQPPNHLLPTRWAAHRGGLRWEKTSAHGDFSLLPIWLGGQQTNGPFDATGDAAAAGAPVICPQCRDAGFVAVCFNVYSKTFTYPCFETAAATHQRHDHLHGGNNNSSSSGLEAFRLWNGCLTERLSAAADEEEWPLMVLRPCCRRRGPMTQATQENQQQEEESGVGETGHIPLYTTTQTGRREDDHPLVARRHEVSLQSNWRTWQTLPLDFQERLRRIVKFALDPDQIFAKDPVQGQGSNPMPSLGVQSLWGDDDFLIYMNDQVYTAWQFSS
ncbi:hypothetical protein PG993_003301 [Apiospora rasikravindrae]|uniref:F-box domain-containing protein n=1 Tax=Apiospora rasikravindrae TaxID=990691 RepID=A0ABR1TZ40_9PEZI